MTPRNKSRTRTSLARERSPTGSALLIIDMISDWRFPDADQILPAALLIAGDIARLKSRCRRAGAPVIYANDNQGRWRSDFKQVIESSLAEGGDGAGVTQAVMPDPDDYFILKPKHCAFFATPLELLLAELAVRRLVITGLTSDQCVLATAAAARMRGLGVLIPRDCVASLTNDRNERALRHFDEVLGVGTPLSSSVRFAR